MSRPRILIAEPLDFSPRALALLEQAAEVERRACGRDELRRAFDQYDVVWVRLAHRIDGHLLPERPRCRLLAVPTTGLDHIDLAACRQRGVRVVSLRGETEFLSQVRATAELTLALALALLRRICPASRCVSRGQWDRDRFRGRELFGSTVGVVGLGRLGSIVARYFAALGANVLGYDPRPDVPADIRRVAALDELLSASDVVTLHVNYHPGTRHLIGPAELAAMKPGAVLVNTSRGGVIDEPALLDALVRNHLAGAALDVLDGEPDIDAAHPLVAYSRRHANLLIVPHIGGNTVESFEKTEVFLAEKVVALLHCAPHAPASAGTD